MGEPYSVPGNSMKVIFSPLAAFLLFASMLSRAEDWPVCGSERCGTCATAECADGVDGIQAPAVTVPVVQKKPAAANPNRGTLRVGTSDMMVLNNRRWGKPQRITRSREPGGWHEYWRYGTDTTGGKQLHFVNGMLKTIEDIEPPPADAMATATAMLEERSQ